MEYQQPAMFARRRDLLKGLLMLALCVAFELAVAGAVVWVFYTIAKAVS